MRYFNNIAKLIRTKRMAHPSGYSQSELSHLLGYKNGQFISNVERALCNIPLKMLKKVSNILDIPVEDLKIALMKDQEQTLDNFLYGDINDKVTPHRRKEEGGESTVSSNNNSARNFD